MPFYRFDKFLPLDGGKVVYSTIDGLNAYQLLEIGSVNFYPIAVPGAECTVPAKKTSVSYFSEQLNIFYYLKGVF